MKKVLLFVAATLLLISCSKDNLTTNGLVGTLWKSELYNSKYTMDIEFISTSSAKSIYYKNGDVGPQNVLSYNLDYPEISFSFNGELAATGTFTDNKTLILSPSEREYVITLHKQ